ncbi:MAG TPA: S8 family serine peptidase [Puia sp.]|nr:S8 family serine peptidase [Puia sp.]
MTKAFVLMLSAMFLACARPRPIPNWQAKDFQKDGLFGISSDLAYEELLSKKKPSAIVVAVIDSGIDTTQENLRPVLWSDTEDGSHGRNFIAEETGKEDFIYQLFYKKNEQGYDRTFSDYKMHVARLQSFINQLRQSKILIDQMLETIGKNNPSTDDFKKYTPRNDVDRWMLGLVLQRMPAYPDFATFKYAQLDKLLSNATYHLSHGLKMDLPPADNVDTLTSADVSNDPLGLAGDPIMGAYHGTYIAGIIAAVRNDGRGINGIAANARIMALKLSGGIREMRNSDLAKAIRYAADHGARIINMSFGKTFSVHRESVDSAVKYAMSKGLLMIHSAGNDGMNLDIDSNAFYPSPKYRDGAMAQAWITVGASGYRDDSALAAPFSNFGRTAVDVFAPGVQITSTIPFNDTQTWDGTSQAGAVVSGLAALIWSYYPNLSAMQVKDIILRSVVKREVLQSKCFTSGVVNAYKALQLAADYK